MAGRLQPVKRNIGSGLILVNEANSGKERRKYFISTPRQQAVRVQPDPL